jgi:hypothetical protein
MIGFIPLWEYEGRGAAVDRVVDGESFANNCGLKNGDVIIRANDVIIDKMEDLDSFKKTVKRGDSVTMIVERKGSEVELRGKLPEIDRFPLFDYKKASGLVRAKAVSNRVEIETSRVDRLRILVNPELFRPAQKLTVIVNGEIKHDQLVIPDIAFMLRHFIEHRDRSQIYMAEIPIEL